jgi:hypothetical protein
MTEQDLIGALFTLIPGTLLLAYAGTYLILGLWSQIWPQTACKIDSLTYTILRKPGSREQGGGTPSYEIHGSYSYEVHGSHFESERIGVNKIVYSDSSKADSFISRVTSSPQAYYCPIHPSLACLSTGPTRGSIFGTVFGAVLISIYFMIINS